IDLVTTELRRDPWSGRIAARVGTIIFILPEHFSVGFIQAQDPLNPLNFSTLKRVRRIAGARRKLTISDIYSSMGDSRSGISRPDARAPEYGRTGRWECLDDVLFAPNRIAVGTQPLRPIVGQEAGGPEYYCDEYTKPKIVQ